MKNQLVVLGIILLFVCVGLSGCDQSTNSGVDIKLLNTYDSELNVTVYITGDNYAYMDWNASQRVTSKTVDVHIEPGGEKSAHFDNLRMDFKNRNGVTIDWSVWVESNLGHKVGITIQEGYNATSPSILQNGATLKFWQNGNVTKVG